MSRTCGSTFLPNSSSASISWSGCSEPGVWNDRSTTPQPICAGTSFNCVTIVNGVARREFHRLEAIERGGSRELRPVDELTVAVPLQGYVHALGLLDSVRERFRCSRTQ